MATIKCGHCTSTHPSAAVVKACSQGLLFTCHWAVERPFRWVEDPETGELFDVEGGTFDCGADAIGSERGWTCTAGHEHVNTQTRHDEGWDYAEEYGEALNMALAGIEPLTMDGHLVLGPQSFAPGNYALAGVR